MKAQERDSYGRFTTESEPALSKLTVRVPTSLRAQVEQLAGDKMADWLRAAIIEKLNRDKA